MKLEEYAARLRSAAEHADDLQRRFKEANADRLDEQLFSEVLDNLLVTLDNLHAAEEQLQVQEHDLTLMREKLYWERERYHELFDFAPDAYLVTNIHGRIVDANHAAAGLLGVQNRFLVGKPLLVYFTSEFRPGFLNRLHQLQTRSTTEQWDATVQSRAGERSDVMIRALRSTFPEGEGSPGEIRWQFRDITERKHREREEREEFFRATFEDAAVGIAHVGARGEWLRTNPHLRELLGYSAEELAQLTVHDLIFPEDQMLSRAHQMKLISGEQQTLSYEMRFRCKDGRTLWAMVSGSAVRTSSDRFLYTILVVSDIGARMRIERSEKEQRAIAEVLRDTALLLTTALDLPTIIRTILGNIGRVVQHDLAFVLMIDEDRAYVATADDRQGDTPAELDPDLRSFEIAILEVEFLKTMNKTCLPIVIPDWQDHGAFDAVPQTESMHALVGAPILSRGEVTGFLVLFARQSGFFADMHAQLLIVFASQAASALQNARAHEQARTLAVMNERHRLARDLHDAVTQTLFSASMVSETLPRLWKEMPEKLLHHLDQIHLLTRGALAEMRVLLLELRPDQLTRINLSTQIRQLADALRARKHIDITLKLDDEYAIPVPVTIALYRITQEGVNNVVKHSNATELDIDLVATESRILLTIEDNGVGFIPVPVEQSTGFGLYTMRERAQEIGAAITITSAPDQGTTISVDWQREAQEESG
ncbi:MAG: PAS domain S-box protein [Chloroflexi bacterium]|nr:PAS domain S-box protein [Chloroflexota bacterium]